MVVIDFVMLALISVGIARGAMTGGIKQLLSFAGVVVALLLAAPLSDIASGQLLKHTKIAEEFVPILSFLVIFAVIQIGAYFLARLLETFLKAIKLGVIDKFLGGFVGAFKAVLVIGIILFTVRFIGIPAKETRESSLFYESVYSIVPAVWEFLVGAAPEASEVEIEIEEDI